MRCRENFCLSSVQSNPQDGISLQPHRIAIRMRAFVLCTVSCVCIHAFQMHAFYALQYKKCRITFLHVTNYCKKILVYHVLCYYVEINVSSIMYTRSNTCLYVIHSIVHSCTISCIQIHAFYALLCKKCRITFVHVSF